RTRRAVLPVGAGRPLRTFRAYEAGEPLLLGALEAVIDRDLVRALTCRSHAPTTYSSYGDLEERRRLRVEHGRIQPDQVRPLRDAVQVIPAPVHQVTGPPRRHEHFRPVAEQGSGHQQCPGPLLGRLLVPGPRHYGRAERGPEAPVRSLHTALVDRHRRRRAGHVNDPLRPVRRGKPLLREGDRLDHRPGRRSRWGGEAVSAREVRVLTGLPRPEDALDRRLLTGREVRRR